MAPPADGQALVNLNKTMGDNSLEAIAGAAARLKDRIKKLLIANASPSQIARSLGCSPSYISQLMVDENFARDVLEGRAASLEKSSNLSERYDCLEEKMLGKLEEMSALPMKFHEVTRALQVLGAKKRDPKLEDDPDSKVQKVIHLHLRPKIAERFIMDSHRNVIGLGGKSLLPMTSSDLIKDAKASGVIIEVTKDELSCPQSTSENIGEDKARISRKPEEGDLGEFDPSAI